MLDPLKSSKAYPLGCYVKTPTGRMARVLGHTDEGRVRLRYMGGDALDVVELLPKHCERNTAPSV